MESPSSATATMMSWDDGTEAVAVVSHVLKDVLDTAVVEGERRRNNINLVKDILGQVVEAVVSKSEEKREEASAIAPLMVDLVWSIACSRLGWDTSGSDPSLNKNIKQEVREENGYEPNVLDHDDDSSPPLDDGKSDDESENQSCQNNNPLLSSLIQKARDLVMKRAKLQSRDNVEDSGSGSSQEDEKLETSHGFQPVRVKPEPRDLEVPEQNINSDLDEVRSEPDIATEHEPTRTANHGFQSVVKQEPKELQEYSPDSSEEPPDIETTEVSVVEKPEVREAKKLAALELKALKKSVLDDSSSSAEVEESSYESDESANTKAIKKEKRLKKRSQRRMAMINVANDKKLNGKAKVVLTTMASADLKNTVITSPPSKDDGQNKKVKSSNLLDPEIGMLCNIGALKTQKFKKVKVEIDSSSEEEIQDKIERPVVKKEYVKKRSVEDQPLEDTDSEEDEAECDRLTFNPFKNFDAEVISAEERARQDVLVTSESSLSDSEDSCSQMSGDEDVPRSITKPSTCAASNVDPINSTCDDSNNRQPNLTRPDEIDKSSNHQTSEPRANVEPSVGEEPIGPRSTRSDRAVLEVGDSDSQQRQQADDSSVNTSDLSSSSSSEGTAGDVVGGASDVKEGDAVSRKRKRKKEKKFLSQTARDRARQRAKEKQAQVLAEMAAKQKELELERHRRRFSSSSEGDDGDDNGDKSGETGDGSPTKLWKPSTQFASPSTNGGTEQLFPPPPTTRESSSSASSSDEDTNTTVNRPKRHSPPEGSANGSQQPSAKKARTHSSSPVVAQMSQVTKFTSSSSDEDENEDKSPSKSSRVKQQHPAPNTADLVAVDDSDSSDTADTKQPSTVAPTGKVPAAAAAAPKRKRARKRRNSKGVSEDETESDSDDGEPEAKRVAGAGDASGDQVVDEVVIDVVGDDEASPSKANAAGRHNIRQIISDNNLNRATKEAAVEEAERRTRMEERQAKYSDKCIVRNAATGKIVRLCLDFDEETGEPTVEVHPQLCRFLKEHQATGIQFLWDAVFESAEEVRAGRVPGGAILAHCMGLGKTLQAISLIHCLMTNFSDKVSTVLILCPVNTIKNWVEEFEKWLSTFVFDYEVFEMTSLVDNAKRAERLETWHNEGGIMIMGYGMFRKFANNSSVEMKLGLGEKKSQFRRRERRVFRQTLLTPGPHLVICDEGHLMKNTKSALNVCVNKISTRRRIVLTGTPLQNNLNEYFAMVDFVKPKLLGSYNEFKNRFVNPIHNGQHSDSTERDVRIMKARSFILSDLLKGCMQRLDYNVLVPFLQPKHEYVLCICLTDFQKKLYKHYLDNYARAGRIGYDGKLVGGRKGGLFYDVQHLSRIWSHPYILAMSNSLNIPGGEEGINAVVKEEEVKPVTIPIKAKKVDDDIEIIEIDSSSDEDDNGNNVIEYDSDGAPILPKKKKKKNLSNGTTTTTNGTSTSWWAQHLVRKPSEFHLSDKVMLSKISLGSKMILLMEILKECEMTGDKVLVFSQSLLSLDLIEMFLKKMNQNRMSKRFIDVEKNFLGSWVPGQDYYRMDGSTSAEARKKCCDDFNRKSNARLRLFLISTKAGGLGINLCAANRVIIFDASWNPAHDVQSVFRVYRFGQDKPVYIYRFLAKGTMEEKIYDRQVTKQSLAARVIDEQQIERHFSMNELTELYEYKDEPMSRRPIPKVPKDVLLAELIKKHPSLIWKYHDHDSLLENQIDENLTEDERKLAWQEFEQEKKGLIPLVLNKQNKGNTASQPLANTSKAAIGSSVLVGGGLTNIAVPANINPAEIQEEYRQQYPHLTEEQVIQATRSYIMSLLHQNHFVAPAGPRLPQQPVDVNPLAPAGPKQKINPRRMQQIYKKAQQLTRTAAAADEGPQLKIASVQSMAADNTSQQAPRPAILRRRENGDPTPETITLDDDVPFVNANPVIVQEEPPEEELGELILS